MSFSSLARSLFCSAMVCACAHQPWPEPPPVDRDVFLSEHAAWRLKRQQVVRDNRAIVAPVALQTDNDSVPSELRFGSYRLWIHVVEDHFYVRVRDTANAHLSAFRLPQEYEPNARWRVAGRFNPYKRPRKIRIADIVGVDEAFSVLGELVFRVDGRQLRLQTFAEPGDPNLLWLMFGDSTNLHETYGGGR